MLTRELAEVVGQPWPGTKLQQGKKRKKIKINIIHKITPTVRDRVTL